MNAIQVGSRELLDIKNLLAVETFALPGQTRTPSWYCTRSAESPLAVHMQYSTEEVMNGNFI